MTHDHEQTSSITFGGIPNFVTTKNNENLFLASVSHRVAGDNHWILKMNDIKVGKTSIKPIVKLALTDTGTSLLHLDKLDYMNLIELVCAGLDCFETETNVWAI